MTARRSAFAHPYACQCAACQARVALALLDTGRHGAARELLARLPDLIVEELGWALVGRVAGRRHGTEDKRA